MTPPGTAFWETTPLNKMTRKQWESLCDGCGRCCLQKLENKKTGTVFYTWVACYLLDTRTCRCSDYKHRRQRVPGCIELTPNNITKMRWLPKSCAYRLLSEGKKLKTWHPLISGTPESTHLSGMSIQNLAVSEEAVHPDHLEDFIIENQRIFRE